jgi:hypothetical protein
VEPWTTQAAATVSRGDHRALLVCYTLTTSQGIGVVGGMSGSGVGLVRRSTAFLDPDLGCGCLRLREERVGIIQSVYYVYYFVWVMWIMWMTVAAAAAVSLCPSIIVHSCPPGH